MPISQDMADQEGVPPVFHEKRGGRINSGGRAMQYPFLSMKMKRLVEAVSIFRRILDFVY